MFRKEACSVLQTPRKTKKHASSALWGNIIGFCGLLALLGLLAVTLSKPDFSQVEKRELAKKPALTLQSLLSAEFMEDFTLWYADTFPGREHFISTAHLLEDMRGIRPDEVKVYETVPAQPADPQPVPEAKPQPAPEAPLPEDPQPLPQQEPAGPVAPPEEDAVGYLMENGIFIFGNRAVNLFGGSQAMAEAYAGVINGYLEEIDPSVQVYNLVAPCSAEFYLPARYRGTSGDQWSNIQHIYGSLDERVKTVDAYGMLAAHRDEDIYFRTDHHWTALGAYYAYTDFCRQAGFEPVPLEGMEARTREGFLGTFYTQTGDPVLQQQPDSLTYYIPDVEYQAWMRLKDQPTDFIPMNGIFGEIASMTNSYSIFLYGDYPLEKIVTENQNGRRIVVIKESYGNAFVSFLLSHYEEIYVVDQRYFQTSLLELMEEAQITDLLFLNNIFAANTSYHIRCIEGLKHQVYQPPVTVAEAEPETDGGGRRVVIVEQPEKKSAARQDGE